MRKTLQEDWNDWGTVENGDAYGYAKTEGVHWREKKMP